MIRVFVKGLRNPIDTLLNIMLHLTSNTTPDRCTVANVGPTNIAYRMPEEWRNALLAKTYLALKLIFLTFNVSGQDYYKATKNLLRLVSTRPIRTETFGSIPVDMSLVPSCVIFITYYTVIALQFNNIV